MNECLQFESILICVERLAPHFHNIILRLLRVGGRVDSRYERSVSAKVKCKLSGQTGRLYVSNQTSALVVEVEERVTGRV